MANCPICGSNLSVVKYRWLTNVLGLTKPYFICSACDWKMTIEEVHKRRGLDRIKKDLMHRKNKYNKGRKRNQRHRRK
mgnify:CR=1 FL=1|jgi:hypothetical protein|tara:strand:+ start:901 stop:1134 length:234 start_codon:yes stop_codon:yes gene_type:complete